MSWDSRLQTVSVHLQCTDYHTLYKTIFEGDNFMYGYIYITTNTVNGKKYIGRRKSEVFLGNAYLGSGVHLKKAVKKYGESNFQVEMIDSANTLDELVQLEMFYIKKYNAVQDESFYNHSPGGYEEGWVRGNQNIACTEYARKRNSEYHRGRKRPQSFVQRHIELHTGVPSGMAGKHHSEETKARLRESTRQWNLSRSSEDYQRVSESAKGNKMMHKDGICKRVHPQDFDTYLSNGWVFGGLARNNSPSKTGRKLITRDGHRKYVVPEDVATYQADGWIVGNPQQVK